MSNVALRAAPIFSFSSIGSNTLLQSGLQINANLHKIAKMKLKW
jgi:hypothetical protein